MLYIELVSAPNASSPASETFSYSFTGVCRPTDLEQEVGSVVDTHDEAADPRHVVDVGEADEADGG